MNRTFRLTLSIAIALTWAMLSLSSSCQNQVSSTGTPPFGSFDNNSFGTINLASLNIHLEVPLRSLPGRGLPLHVSLNSDSNFLGPPGYVIQNPPTLGWTGTGVNTSGMPSFPPFVASGFQAGRVIFDTQSSLQCYVGAPPDVQNLGSYSLYTNFRYMDAQGSVHYFLGNPETASNLNNQVGGDTCPNLVGQLYPAWGSAQFVSSDGSSYLLTITQQANVPATSLIDYMTGMTDDWIDADQNQDSVTNGILSDSSGNVALSPTSSGFSFTGPDAKPQNIGITMGKPFTVSGYNGCAGFPITGGTAGPYVSKIDLPDGTFYKFTYEPVLGRVNTITLPTGGVITYDYGTTAPYGISCEDGGTSGFTKTTPDGIWVYARTWNASTNLWTTTVTDPQQNQTVYTFAGSEWTRAGIGAIIPQFEIQRKVYQKVSGNLQLMETLVTCYNAYYQNCSSGSFVYPPITQKDIYTYLPGVTNPSVSEMTYYGPYVSGETEYDFGAAALLPNAPGAGYTMSRSIDYSDGIFSCPASDITIDSSKNVLASTTYTCSSSGHPLTVKRWISGSTYATTTNTYYSTGLLHTTQDPNGNTTTYTYGECNNSFPTSINAAGIVTQMNWNCTGEVPTSVTDAQSPGNVTTFSYEDSSGVGDPFWRLRWTFYPDHGKTTVDYYPTPTPPTLPYVQSTQRIDSSHTLTTQTNYDALGRPVTQLVTSGTSNIETDTTYDSLGRVASVTNPYQGPDDPTYGSTLFTYDALNRKTSQTNPDLTTRWWCYNNVATNGQPNCHAHLATGQSGNGSWVDSADEIGNDWQQTSDGLGRLTSALEPNGSNASPSMETDYTYDNLSRLSTVVQKGVVGTDTPRPTRTFNYDGLSRLTSAFNPESGTTTYAYDGNGNLLQKTSPALNVLTGGSGTQTLGYCYDAWNHLVGKWSAAPPSGCNTTPTSIISSLLATYTYGAPGSSNNTVGRLIDETSYLAGSTISDLQTTSYDSMGRDAQDLVSAYFPMNYQYQFAYGYNQAGDLTNFTPPFGDTTAYTYDAVNRLNSVTYQPLAPCTLNCLMPPAVNIFQSPAYGPAGLIGATYGNGTSLKRNYDVRMRAIDHDIYSTGGAFGSSWITITGSASAGDSGTLTFTAYGGVAASVSYNATSTALTVAQALVTAINESQDTPVVAAVDPKSTNSSAQIDLTAAAAGSATDSYTAVTAKVNGTSDPFTIHQQGTVIQGGSGTDPYEYKVSYTKNGNIYASQDSYDGSFLYSLDTLNRVTKVEGASGTTRSINGTNYADQCWNYDSFGNRNWEVDQNNGGVCPTTPPGSGTSGYYVSAAYSTSNQLTSTATSNGTNNFQYDLAGNIVSDGLNNYVYDAEGRLCAVKNTVSQNKWQYVYDAEGRRVAKGTTTAWPAQGNACGAPLAANGFTATNVYLRGELGTQDTEITGTGNWVHTNIFADGALTATAWNASLPTGWNPQLAYDYGNWVGTKRVELNAVGQVNQFWRSDPYGDYLTTPATLGATEHMYTGQERDSESGNDYFNARYYESSMGRFMRPDWSEDAQPVPYASVGNPQSLNLYAYSFNNPIALIDPSGHFAGGESGGCMDEMMDVMGNGSTADPFGGANCQSLFNPQFTPGSAPGSSTLGGAEDQYASNVSSAFSGGDSFAAGADTIYVRCTGASIFNYSCRPDPSDMNYFALGEFTYYSHYDPDNGQECDNSCQLAHALGKTGVYQLTKGTFYACSAGILVGAAVVVTPPAWFGAGLVAGISVATQKAVDTTNKWIGAKPGDTFYQYGPRDFAQAFGHTCLGTTGSSTTP